MSAAAHRSSDPEPQTPLSALEEALRRALESSSQEQVLERVVRVLPEARAAQQHVPVPGLHGKVQKVSVSLPSELIEAIRARTGAGGFSRYVSDAVQNRIRHDLLGDLLDELEAEYGPIDEEGVREAMKEWPDYEGE
jgi:Arc/MetJ-type ribon-helix-helix transcriptional regulator